MAYGGLIEILYQWEYLGVFDIVLPFLLVFAIVFGILSSTRFMGDNKAVYVVIAVVIGLMSLRFGGFVSEFMTELFPRLGIGLSVLLTILILVGLFIAKDETRYWGWGLAIVAVIIVLVILYQTFDRLGYYVWGYYGSDTVSLVILAIFVVGVIIALAASKREGKKSGLADFLDNWKKSS